MPLTTRGSSKAKSALQADTMAFLCHKKLASRKQSNAVFELLENAFEGAVTTTLRIIGSTTSLAPVCETLEIARKGLQAVRVRKKRLEELHHKCELITTCVILLNGRSPPDFSLLNAHVHELNNLVKTYADRSRCVAYLHMSVLSDGRIDSLESDINTVVSVMDLATSVRTAIGAETRMRALADLEAAARDVLETQERAHAAPTLAPVPKNVPRPKGWHIVRMAAMRAVHKRLSEHEGRGAVGIVGRSGSGKTTLAAAIVGERSGCFQFCGERDNQELLAEVDRVREMFSDGIVWLRVGRDVCAPDRLRELMQELARTFHKAVMQPGIEAPQLGEDGAVYVRNAITTGNGGKVLSCLVVADDVWDAEVVKKLLETGMRVLLTTRVRSLVDQGMRVSAEKLTDPEAKELLRATVQLPRGTDLPDISREILDRCDNVAMYVEFVGRWSLLKTGEDGVPQDRGAWVEVVRAIDRSLDEQADDDKDTRLAILHAGFKYLGNSGPLVQELYMALAVLPDGHPFAAPDAAALLFDDGEARYSVTCAKRVIVTLEQWAVITRGEPDMYHMHDAHTAFGKDNLMAHEAVRKNAVRRWTDVVSAPSFVCTVDSFTVVSMWRALESVNGVSWRVCRRYDAELDAMHVSNELFRQTAEAIAMLYYAEGDYHGAESLMHGVWNRCYKNAEADPKVVLSSLWFCMEAAKLKGDADKTAQLLGQLEPLMEKLRQGMSDGEESSDAEKCFSLHMFGLCCFRMGEKQEAERFHRQALDAQQRCNLGERHPLVAHTLYSLGVCLRSMGRLPEAEIHLRRTVDVLQARLTPDDLQVAYAIRKLACIVRESHQPIEAVDLLKQSLQIFRATLPIGSDDLQIAVTLHELGRSLLETERPAEAKAVLQEALEIKEALSEPPDDKQLSTLEQDLLSCEPRAGYA